MNTRTLTAPSRVSLAIIAAGVAVVALLGVSALIARADTAPAITNAIQNGNTTVTSAAIGTTVHDVVTVASTTASTTPTGTVDFSLYSNTSCSGVPTTQSAVTLVNGMATSSDTTVPAAGLSYLVHYNGDASTTAANSACQALTATASSVTLSTSLSTSTVLAGSSVYDTATINNETANATGTVAYNVYTNNLCTTGSQSAGAKTVTNGSVPNSDAVAFNTAGNYYWQAVYSGDQNNSGATSSCLALQVLATSTPVTPPATTTPGTISGTFYNDANGNDKKDASESGLSGWTVWLHMGNLKDGYDNPIVKTATTDANGNYSFTNLAAGNYFVEEEEQNGWNQTSSDTKVVLTASTSSAVVNFANMTNGSGSNGHDGKGNHHGDNGGYNGGGYNWGGNGTSTGNGTTTGNGHHDGDNDNDDNSSSTNNGNHYGNGIGNWFGNVIKNVTQFPFFHGNDDNKSNQGNNGNKNGKGR